mgnify:CR=1 FL=1
MKKETWMIQYSEEFRKMVCACFLTVGSDFEKEFLTEGDSPQAVKIIDTWLTRKEAACIAKCSCDTIDNWCAKGFIEKSKLNDSRPGAVLILRASLEKFLRSRVIRKKRIRSDCALSIKGGYRVNGKKS